MALTPPGVVVELRGLAKAPSLNGARAVCLGQTQVQVQSGRIGVRLDDGRELSVKVDCTSPLHHVERSASCGMGCVASRDLEAGSLLVREAPTLRGRLGEKPNKQDLKALTALQRERIFELADLYSSDRPSLEGIFCTNALPRSSSSKEPSDEGLLCLNTSRFNHSCAPNCEFLWLEKDGVEEVRTVRAVRAGENLCVNYLGDAVRGPTEMRRKALGDGFRFVCRCRCCENSSEKSDIRRRRLLELDDEILAKGSFQPEVGLRLCEEALELLELEDLGAPRTVAQICNDGFQLSIMAGLDQTEVQHWAHMSYEAHRLGWGSDHPMTRQMLRYAQQPPSLSEKGPAPNARSTAGTGVRGRSSPTHLANGSAERERTDKAKSSSHSQIPAQDSAHTDQDNLESLD